MKVQLFDDSLEKFIKSLEKPTIAKTLRTIELLESFGERLGMPFSKKITSGIFELRVRGAQEVRILFTFYKGSAMLLSGFVKKGRKTPRREIDKALQRIRRFD
ncbi:MAG: type II toxin-antitoxin system RelE/ParE family toxin [bacterium]|nr:type II toxin-antitoxin system RelE/ParE family toxin [bacterium]